MSGREFDVIIVGGGPGGYTAAVYSARAGLKTLVLEMLSPGGQMATTSDIENFPGFSEGIDGFDLGEKMKEGADRFGALTEFAEVTALDLSASSKRVVISDGDYFAKTLIIATGANPTKLNLPGEDALRGRKGVAYCASCDGAYFRGKTVAVVGGGDTAAAYALELSKLCEKVYLVHRRDRLRAEKSYHQRLEKAGNIQFVWNSAVIELLHDQVLTGLKLKNTRTDEISELSCDGVFAAVGRTPNTELVKGQLELTEAGYIKADETTVTSVPGVFAVGDVREKPLRQIVTAAADGAVAAKFAADYISTL